MTNKELSNSEIPLNRVEKKNKTRADVRNHALKLFFKQGFSNVSVEEIVKDSPMSLRTFYRYFPTKEDVVFDWYDEVTDILISKLESRPDLEDAFESLQKTLYSLLEIYDANSKVAYAHLCMTNENPTLAAKSLEKRLKWQFEFSIILSKRIKGSKAKKKATLISAIALSAFYSATDEWYQLKGKANLRKLMDESFTLTKVVLK